MQPTTWRLATAVLAAAGGLGLGFTNDDAGAAPAAGSPPSTVIVRPAAVPVNSDTLVVGRHFKAHTRVGLLECTHTTWIAPRHPCTSGNGLTATTDAAGAFRVRIKVRSCPGMGVPAAESAPCYIGVVKPSGVDMIELQPNAGIVVTFP